MSTAGIGATSVSYQFDLGSKIEKQSDEGRIQAVTPAAGATSADEASQAPSLSDQGLGGQVDVSV